MNKSRGSSFRSFFQGSLLVTREYRGRFYLKRYHYPFAKSSNDALERMQGWASFSLSHKIIQPIELTRLEITQKGLFVDIMQKRLYRQQMHRSSQTFAYLKELQLSLERAWEIGLVHGDLNRKNILLTEAGFRIIDIEPLITIPLSTTKAAFRTTIPYIAPSDFDKGKITESSDRLGFACFSDWVNGFVDQPAHALRKNLIS